jgi:hypothetical protein
MPKKGFKHSEATKEQMRRSATGNSDGGMSGKHHNEDSNEKNRQAHLGKVAWNKGIKMPQSFCKTMSEVQRGKTIPHDVREKISASLSGIPKSVEHVKKVAAKLIGRPISEETRKRLANSHLGKELSEFQYSRIIESQVGGFWIGNVNYNPPSVRYCEKWKDVNPRVHAFFNYECVECGTPENGKSHVGHHVFYVKEACCWHDENGLYYTNLNARDHKSNDYFIGDNPNYFVILCPKCHGKTNGTFENRKIWADHFKEMIDLEFGGKCFFTKEEMAGRVPPG